MEYTQLAQLPLMALGALAGFCCLGETAPNQPSSAGRADDSVDCCFASKAIEE